MNRSQERTARATVGYVVSFGRCTADSVAVDNPTTTSTGHMTTTSVPGVTTATVPDEVLVYTRTPDRRLFLLAIAMVASGGWLLSGERRSVLAGVGFMPIFRRRCEQCRLEAEFITPHGKLCRTHTRKALDKDDVLWMPSKLKRRTQR